MRTIKGRVIFKATTGKSIQPNAVLTVSVQDCSLQDAPSVTLGQRVIKEIDSFPIEFECQFDDKVIEEKSYGTYTISATIRSADDKLLYLNDTSHPIVDSSSGKILDTIDVEVIKI